MPLICQVHTLDRAFEAVDVGADVVVAQGAEAGGRGWALRSTMPFVPSVVDALVARHPMFSCLPQVASLMVEVSQRRSCSGPTVR